MVDGIRCRSSLVNERALLRLLLVVSFIAFAASVLLREHAGTNLAFDAGLYNVPFVVAAMLCLTRHGDERVAWRLLGAGLLVYATADVYSTVWLNRLQNHPFPSWADAGWLAFYPLAYASLAILARRRLRTTSSAAWLDGAIGGFGAVALTAAMALAPIIHVTAAPFATVATNLAYPTGDLLLVAFVVALASVLGARLDRRFTLLGAGFAAFAIADTIYLFEAARNTYVEGGLVDLVWPTAAVLIGLAASLDTRPAEPASRGATAIALPMVFSVAAIGVLASQTLTAVPTPAVVAALMTLGLAVVRVGLTVHEFRTFATARSQARTDELTGLGNRRAFYERAHALLHGRSSRAPAALLLVDLDGFKIVNDTGGHHVGDELLGLVGPRIEAALSAQSFVARIGGDEFAIVVGADRDVAEEIAIRVRSRLREPFVLEARTFRIDASIGISVWPGDGTTIDALMRRADIAMYADKRSHAYAWEKCSDPDGFRDRPQAIDELREGLAGGQLVVHYQPILRAADRVPVAAEALVRWQHPRDGLLAPGAFLAIAERHGLAVGITDYVLAVALRDCAGLRRAGHELAVCVNLARSDMRDPALAGRVAAALARAPLAPETLTLEITQPAVSGHADVTNDSLVALRTLGVRLSLDNFGSESTSPAHLRTFPLDAIKLDHSLTFCAADDPIARSIISGATGIANVLGLDLIAEGVEDASAEDATRALGCSHLQGFALAPPMPIRDLRSWLADGSTRVATQNSART